MSVAIQQHRRAGPTALSLHPLEICCAGKVEARESMAQPVRREASILTKHLANESPKDSVAEVVGVDEATLLVWEDKVFIPEQIGSARREYFLKSRREFDSAGLTRLREGQVASVREAPADPRGPALQVKVNPALGGAEGGVVGSDYIGYVKGANIASFVKVADAMLAYGVV